MTSTHPESLHSGARILPRSDTSRRKGHHGGLLRLAIGALAVLILVALGTLDAGRSTLDQTASDAVSLAEPDFAPAVAYDGRGKWGGY